MKGDKWFLSGNVAHWAITEWGLNYSMAQRMTPSPEWFADRGHVMKTFARKRDAVAYLHVCREKLAYQSGRLGRWISPSFTVGRLN